MDELYEQLITLLNEIPEMEWPDLDVNQLDEEKPPVNFPCGLIDISQPKREDITTTSQQVQCRFTIKVAVKALGETHGKTTAAIRSNSLQYFTTSKAVYEKLQGFTNDKFYPFSCIAQVPIAKRGLKVIALSFETSWVE